MARQPTQTDTDSLQLKHDTSSLEHPCNSRLGTDSRRADSTPAMRAMSRGWGDPMRSNLTPALRSMGGTRPSLRLSTSMTDVPVDPALPVLPDLQVAHAPSQLAGNGVRDSCNICHVLHPQSTGEQALSATASSASDVRPSLGRSTTGPCRGKAKLCSLLGAECNLTFSF